MSHEAGIAGPRRSAVAGAALVVAAGLIAGGKGGAVGAEREDRLAGVVLGSGTQWPMITAYKLGTHGKLPDTVGA